MVQIGRFLRWLTELLAFFGCVAVFLMMAHITIDVLFRLLEFPIPATVTIVPHYYMLPIIFLPLAFTERNDAHITVEVLVQLLSSSIQKVLAMLAWAVSIGVFGLLFYQTLLDAFDKTQKGTFMMELDWKIWIWPSYYFLPIGFGLVILVLVYRIVITITGGTSGLGEVKHDAFAAPEAEHEKSKVGD